MPTYKAAAVAPGISGADISMSVRRTPMWWEGHPWRRAYEGEKGGGTVNAQSAGAEGSMLAGCPMYANPSGGLLSGKLLYMDKWMAGELGTAGTRGGTGGCQL
jgi:hypothetical protein